MRISKPLRLLNPPAQLGHLVDSTSSKVPIIRSMPLETASETYSLRSKFHPLTEEGRSPNPGMMQIPHELSGKINKITLGWSPQEIRQRVAQMYHRLQKGQSHSPALDKLDVDSQVMGMFLQNYVSLTNTLREIKKRRPEFKPKRILDIGFGPATGLLAAREVFGYDGAIEQEENSHSAIRETAVIIGHPRMKRRAKEFLGDATKVLFRDDVPSQSSPKRFDLIIATHQLYQHGQFVEQLVDSHTQQVAQILDKNGVALFVERGDPLGFESVALAREHMTRPKYGYNVVGPCTHNLRCPLQVGLGIRQSASRPARENWCRFSQNVNRPKFTKELKKGQYLSQEWVPDAAFGAGGKSLKGKGRPGGNSNEIAFFSWVAMENVKSPESPESSSDKWPRIMKQPQKRHGHVIMEICAPSGNIEHWTIPKSQGKQAYHDVRKANASDLWALDAKVKQVRGGLRRPDEMKASKPRATSDSNEDASAAKINELLDEPCKDWWHPKSNPFYKFSSHQARIHSENMAEPEQDGFIPVMESLIADEGNFDKMLNKRGNKQYRR